MSLLCCACGVCAVLDMVRAGNRSRPLALGLPAFAPDPHDVGLAIHRKRAGSGFGSGLTILTFAFVTPTASFLLFSHHPSAQHQSLLRACRIQFSEDRMIRPVVAKDIPAIRSIIDATELFPSEMLQDMIQPYLNTDDGDSKDIWIAEVGDNNDTPIAVAYCVPEKMTEGTWNALLLAVQPGAQGQGYGSRLMRHLESKLKTEHQARILLVETAGSPEFARQREFYGAKLGYEKVATIPEFYQPAEDKVIFLQKISSEAK